MKNKTKILIIAAAAAVFYSLLVTAKCQHLKFGLPQTATDLQDIKQFGFGSQYICCRDCGRKFKYRESARQINKIQEPDMYQKYHEMQDNETGTFI